MPCENFKQKVQLLTIPYDVPMSDKLSLILAYFSKSRGKF
jgi:hypothetical protein